MFSPKYKFLNALDPALPQLEKRLAQAGCDGVTLTYSQLVKDIEFHVPNLHGGQPFRIDEFQNPNYRILVGEYLTYISRHSHYREGFLASALVVGSDSDVPSQPFFDLATELGVLKPSDNQVNFWSREIKKAYAYYQYIGCPESANGSSPDA